MNEIRNFLGDRKSVFEIRILANHISLNFKLLQKEQAIPHYELTFQQILHRLPQET